MSVRVISRVPLTGLFFGSRFFHGTSNLDRNIQFSLSDIGEGIREVTLKSWHVKVNDKVSQFDNICEVESDKATVTITSRYDGIIKRLYYNPDDVAFVGKPLVDIDVEDEEDTTKDEVTDGNKTIQKENGTVKDSNNIEREESIKSNSLNLELEHQQPIEWDKSLATPAVRRIAMEHNIKLSDVKATGRKNRVLKEDILAYLETKNQTENVPEKCEIKPVSRIMKIMIKTMTLANTVPTFSYADLYDFGKLIEIRSKLNEQNLKITYLPFVVKAFSKALLKYPIVNSSADVNYENIIYKNVHNISVAVDSPQGLVVPNIKHVESLSILEISDELQRLQKSAYDGTLATSDLTGGTFSVSNIGAIGGLQGIPVVLPPEVAIVAIGKIQKVPRFDSNNQIIASNLVNFTFSADHRILDGASISRFSNLTKKYIENPELLLIEL